MTNNKILLCPHHSEITLLENELSLTNDVQMLQQQYTSETADTTSETCQLGEQSVGRI